MVTDFDHILQSQEWSLQVKVKKKPSQYDDNSCVSIRNKGFEFDREDKEWTPEQKEKVMRSRFILELWARGIIYIHKLLTTK